MTPRKESHFTMPRAIPAPTGIPVVEPWKTSAACPESDLPLYILLETGTLVRVRHLVMRREHDPGPRLYCWRGESDKTISLQENECRGKDF